MHAILICLFIIIIIITIIHISNYRLRRVHGVPVAADPHEGAEGLPALCNC